MLNSLSIYDVIMTPMEKRILQKARKALVPMVHGRVLEIGAGTGANLPFYPFDLIKQLSFVDTSLHRRITEYPYPPGPSVDFAQGRMESLSFPTNHFDFVVITLVLCSVSDIVMSLHEVYRVLKPGGTMVFIEHVSPRRPVLKHVFDFLTPVWKKIAHNCHLNRKTLKAIRTAGFVSVELYPVYKDIFIGGTVRKPEMRSM